MGCCNSIEFKTADEGFQIYLQYLKKDKIIRFYADIRYNDQELIAKLFAKISSLKFINVYRLYEIMSPGDNQYIISMWSLESINALYRYNRKVLIKLLESIILHQNYYISKLRTIDIIIAYGGTYDKLLHNFLGAITENDTETLNIVILIQQIYMNYDASTQTGLRILPSPGYTDEINEILIESYTPENIYYAIENKNKWILSLIKTHYPSKFDSTYKTITLNKWAEILNVTL